MSDIKKIYEDVVIKLISRDQFYAHILLQLDVIFNDKFPTAGVGIIDNKLKMIIGVDFFKNLTEEQRIFVLKHELAHIILGHLADERRGDKEDAQIWNIAKDTAIHEIITEAKTLFPKEDDIKPCTVESLRKMIDNNDIRNNETSEYYFNFLKQLKDELKEKLKDYKFDEHNLDGDQPVDPDLAKALTVGLLEKAKERVGAGNCPHDAELTIDKFKKSKYNWRAALRRYTASQVDCDIRNTRNKRNKRYGFMVPGKRKKFQPKVVTIVDTSGSMDQERLASVWAELVKMEKQGYEIVVIEADAEAHKSYEFSSKRKLNFTGGGGTLYQPALDAAAKETPDVCIYLTDMDPADTPTKPRFPVIWAAVADGGFKPTFGHVILIKD